MNTQDIRERAAAFGKDIARFLKETLGLILQNRTSVILFILISSVFSLMATSGLTSLTTWLLMRLSGVSYLSPANIASVVLRPTSLLVLLLEQVLATLIALFQIAGLLHAYSMSQIGLETNLSSLFAAGLRTCRKALRPKNWLVVLFVLVLLPLTKVMALSSTTYKLVIPGFINQTIEYTSTYRVAYAFAVRSAAGCNAGVHICNQPLCAPR